jgi:hypothetical protein
MIFSKEPNSLRYGELSPYGLNRKGNINRSGFSEREKRKQNATQNGEVRRDILVLDYTNPGGLLTVTGTQPDPIRSGEADLDGEMEPNSQPGCMFPVKQVS